MSHAYPDLRAFLARLHEENELATVDAEVDWDLEVGAITRRGLDLRGPALLFNRVTGSPPGYRLASNLVGPTRPVVQGRLALAMGLPKDTPTRDLITEFERRGATPIEPVLIDRAPCQEVVLEGDDIDVLRFPVPKVHAIDGGRYLGTWHVNVTKDPDTGFVNWGMYRHMVHDRNTLGWLANPAQHGPAMYYQKYEAAGQPMPMALAIGTEPIASVIAGTAVPANQSEAALAGAIRGEPVELVRCQSIDLEVPASAEIIVEGLVYPHERRDEGVFGEFTGYAAGERLPRPVFHITAITHRRDPILTMSNMGKPWDEFGVISSVSMSAMLAAELRQRGIPFTAVYVPAPILAVIVAVQPRYAGYAHTLAGAIWSSKAGIYRPYLFVVGDDVDVTDAEDVFWCLTTRLHPSRGIHVLEGTPGMPLFPFLTHQERLAGTGAKVLFDATFPFGSPEANPANIIDFAHGWPEEVQRRVLARWEEYGLPSS